MLHTYGKNKQDGLPAILIGLDEGDLTYMLEVIHKRGTAEAKAFKASDKCPVHLALMVGKTTEDMADYILKRHPEAKAVPLDGEGNEL